MKRQLALGAGVFAAGVASWWLVDTAPYPYSERMVLYLPLPFISNRRLDAMSGIRAGERVLEIGPGIGLQTLHVASRLGPSGRLDIVDIQQVMLDCVMRRARAREIGGIVPTLADAREMPFEDATFDAAYLVCTLGEMPDPIAVLREIRRVLKPTGRLVVGEFVDPHFIPRVKLLRYAAESGLEPAMSLGPPFAYYLRLRPA